jgi:hypothetical protein
LCVFSIATAFRPATGRVAHIEEFVATFRKFGHEVLVAAPGLYRRADFGSESRFLAAIRRVLPSALFKRAEFFYNLPVSLRSWRAFRSFAPDFVYER